MINKRLHFLLGLAHFTSPIYSAPRRVICPEETDDAVPTNATRIFFIGAHHTGTNSYFNLFGGCWGVPKGKKKNMRSKIKEFSFAAHNPSWPYTPTLWFQHDVFTDTPYVPWTEWAPNEIEFGHFKHPDVRLLYKCFPQALFVINTRSLVSWVLSKVLQEAENFREKHKGRPSPPCDSPHYPLPSWNKLAAPLPEPHIAAEMLFPQTPNSSSRSYGRIGNNICNAARAREELHARFLSFVAEDPVERSQRFLITDLPSEGFTNVSLRLCRFVAQWRGTPPGVCEDLRAHKVQHAHKSERPNAKCEVEFVRQALTGKNAGDLLRSPAGVPSKASSCRDLWVSSGGELDEEHLSSAVHTWKGISNRDLAPLAREMAGRFS